MQFTFKLNDVVVQDQVRISKCDLDYEISSEELSTIITNYPLLLKAAAEVLTNMK
jgi:hypothetical protein